MTARAVQHDLRDQLADIADMVDQVPVVEVLVNGKPAEMLSAVGYPGATDAYQVNFRVPPDAAKGPASIQLTAAWIAGTPVTIPVQ